MSPFRCLVVVALLAASHATWAETITGLVVGIADGDTITVLDSARIRHMVRLAGIDAPEKSQPFGDKSQANLARMAFNQSVSLDCRKFDRFKTEFCVVKLMNGQDLNLEQVKAGFAWWNKQYQREQTAEERTAYEQAQFWAQARRLGLWRDTNPVPPWEFRGER